MSKKSKNRTTIIEIDDSTDDESTNTSDSTTVSKKKKSVTISTTTTNDDKNSQKDDENCSTSTTAAEFKKPASDEFDSIPKRIMSRRKSVHHSIRSTENLSFEVPNRKRRESVDVDVVSKLNKKKCWNERQIDDAVDHNLDNPEIEEMLKKIAYCRVFTNYLLRQYDMLAIDFKLYSNLDMLNLDLKMRVDTYTAIRKSRQRFKEAREMNNGQIQL